MPTMIHNGKRIEVSSEHIKCCMALHTAMANALPYAVEAGTVAIEALAAAQERIRELEAALAGGNEHVAVAAEAIDRYKARIGGLEAALAGEREAHEKLRDDKRAAVDRLRPHVAGDTGAPKCP